MREINLRNIVLFKKKISMAQNNQKAILDDKL